MSMSRFEPIGAPLPGRQTYAVSLSLVETVRREQQHRGGSRGAQGRPGATTLSIRSWLRQRACSWQPVPLPANAARLELTSPPVRALPRCRAVPPANEMAYVALEPRGAESCAGWCTGDATARIFNTSNDRASARRSRQGFQHARSREPNPEFRRPAPLA